MTTVWSGLSLGAIYVAIAVGYDIVYLASGRFNFAQAQFAMFGTFAAFVGVSRAHLPWLLVVVLAAIAGGLLGAAEELIAVRPVRRRTDSTQLLTTVAISVVFVGAAALIWGTQPLRVPFGSGRSVSVLGGLVDPIELVLIGTSVAVALVLWALSTRTIWGIAALGAAEDREAAAMRGINVAALSIGALALAGAVGALVGAVMAPKTYAVFDIGNVLAIKAFLALALGGFGSIKGSLVAGLGVGLIEATSNRYLGASSSNLILFAVLVVVLLALPNGFFGARRLRTV